MSDVQKRIDSIVKGGRVVLFMKGTAQFPQCGFSGRAIQVLKASGVKTPLARQIADFAREGVAGISWDGPHGGPRNVSGGDEQFLVYNFGNELG